MLVMDEHFSCIYAIVSPSNSAYIGSTRDFHKRRKSHKSGMINGDHHCDALRKAHKKYGIEAFDFIVLERCPVSQLIVREQWWFDNHGRFDKLYNSSMIAGAVERNPKWRAKMTRALKGRTYSDETRRRMSEGSKGKVASPEAREAMRKAQLGRKHSEETKRKIGDARKGRKYTPEHRAAMSAGIRGSMKPNARSGVCGVSWNSNEKRWKATVWVMGKAIHLGSFKELSDAVAARRAGEEKYLDTPTQPMP